MKSSEFEMVMKENEKGALKAFQRKLQIKFVGNYKDTEICKLCREYA